MSRIFTSETEAGCCICGTRKSSTRFTTSSKYEHMFPVVFDVECRNGEFCNACVLIIKRFWIRYGKNTWMYVEGKKNWYKKVDSANAQLKGKKAKKSKAPIKGTFVDNKLIKKISKKHKFVSASKGGKKTASVDKGVNMLDMMKEGIFYPHHEPYPFVVHGVKNKKKKEISLEEMFPGVNDIEEDIDDEGASTTIEEELTTLSICSSSSVPPSMVSSRSESPVFPTPDRTPEHSSLYRGVSPTGNLYASSNIGAALNNAMCSLQQSSRVGIYNTPTPSPAASSKCSLEEEEDCVTQICILRESKRRKQRRPRHVKDIQSQNASLLDTSTSSLWQTYESCCGRVVVGLNNVAVIEQSSYRPCPLHSAATQHIPKASLLAKSSSLINNNYIFAQPFPLSPIQENFNNNNNTSETQNIVIPKYKITLQQTETDLESYDDSFTNSPTNNKVLDILQPYSLDIYPTLNCNDGLLYQEKMCKNPHIDCLGALDLTTENSRRHLQC